MIEEAEKLIESLVLKIQNGESAHQSS
jgi:hypothetical protein